MARPQLSLLSTDSIEQVHSASLTILSATGVRIHNDRIRRLLADAGVRMDASGTVYFDEALVLQAIQAAGKNFVLHGRDPARQARFGFGEFNVISSPGQFSWFDHHTRQRRDPVLDDARSASKLGDALPNINIVGGMAVPVDVPGEIRDVVLTAELIKNTTKPVRAFPVSARSSYYVLEILKAAAGGEQALRQRPMTELLLEPISPLQLPGKELDILMEFAACGQPVSIGPMAMASGTAPATLAGVLAQENAEILAALIVVQLIAPGTPILYGSIPHILDPRSMLCSFGSPEQGLMALGLTEIGKWYGFPVYVNVNLTDSKRLDIQTGVEKMGSLLQGMLAGADLFGHAGIVGADHGGCLTWLVADDETINFARRIFRGFEVNAETLALNTIAAVGPAGNYLSEPHTVRNYRRELWLPGHLWTRDTYDGWEGQGSTDFEQRAIGLVDRILSEHEPAPLDKHLEAEIDSIVDFATRELVG